MSGPSRVAAVAPAKLNLWLRVFGRDARGYHAVESLYQGISLRDELVLERADAAGSVALLGAPAELGAVDQNLIVRAARRFLSASGAEGGVRVSLVKRIPWNAGLGGGASDAAATLAALNVLFRWPISDEDLTELAGEIGSDVPFFLCGSPLALGWGRGERLLALPPLPARPLLIVPPPVPVRTADAYAWIDQDRGTKESGGWASVVPSEALSSWSEVRRYSHNDFESAVAARLPAIGHWLDRLRSTGALLVRLAGSGGAVAAIYRSAAERDRAWRTLGADPAMIRAATATSVVPPTILAK